MGCNIQHVMSMFINIGAFYYFTKLPPLAKKRTIKCYKNADVKLVIMLVTLHYAKSNNLE